MGHVQLRIALWHGTATPSKPMHLLSGDFQHRLKEVKSALEEARKQWLDGSASSPSVLKIFVGPEGLLAKADDEYAIAYDDFKLESSGLSKLSEGLLFIPGTVIWKKPAIKTSGEESSSSNRLDKIQGQLELYRKRGQTFSENASPHFSSHSHEKAGAARAQTVSKKLDKLREGWDGGKEGWDGGKDVFIVRNAAYAYYNQVRLLKYYKQVEYKPDYKKKTGEVSPLEKQQSRAIKFIPGHEDGVFQVPLAPETNIRCGVEICADHYKGQLKNSTQGKNVHLHFILSDYIYNYQQCVAAQPGGYIIHASTVHSQSGLFTHDSKPIDPVKSADLAVGKLECYAVTLEV